MIHEPFKIEELTQVLQRHYSKEVMQRFYRAFLRGFILENEALCLQYHVAVANARKVQPSKTELVDGLAAIMASGELFRKMVAALPGPMPAIVHKIIWEGGLGYKSMAQEFGVRAVYTRRELGTAYPSALEEVDPVFCLFCDYTISLDSVWPRPSLENLQDKPAYSHYFYFPQPLAAHLKNFTEKPPGFYLEPAPDPDPELTKFSDLESLFTELPVAWSYLQQGKLAVSDAGNVLAGSYGKMRKYCGLKEFYPESSDRNLSNLRTRLLVEMLRVLSQKKNLVYSDPVALIKQAFKLYQQARFSTLSLLFHLKGRNRLNDNGLVNPAMFALLRELPIGQWVSTTNLFQYARYRELPLEPISGYEAANYLYFESEGTWGNDRNFISYANHQDLVAGPALRGSFFLFATFGLVDITYGPPETAAARGYDKPYISVFDGLQAVRLTALGAYIGGLSKHYIAPAVQDEQVVLDDEHLFITYTGTNKPLTAILEKISRTTGNNLYKVDYESLLGDCASQKEVKTKINIFKQLVSDKLPPVWEAFFADIRQKSLALPALNAEYLVFRLPENKELVRLIATDEFLKKNCLKAEMFHVLIAKANVSKVKNYLKKYGFLIDFT